MQQVSSAYAWERETKYWSIEVALFQNIAGRPLNVASIKYLIKQVYQKGCTYKLNKKEDQNNYFRAEVNQR